MENAHLLARSSLPPQAVPGFDGVVAMIDQAVNSPDFAQIFFDLARVFAQVLRLHWDEPTARAEWAAWTSANPLPDNLLTIQVNGRCLRDGPSQFDAESREITLDTSPLLVNERQATPQKTARVQFLLFIKGLHQVAHLMAELILRLFKHLYRNEPYAKRKKIPRETVPIRVGDCGYQLEQLLSGNLRFSFEHACAQKHVCHPPDHCDVKEW